MKIKYLFKKIKSFFKKEIDFDLVYTDQSMKQSFIYDRCITSFYTPEGIRQLDSEYCKRITSMTTREEHDNIKKSIQQNAHLHKIIKDNLLLNLKNYSKYLVN